jgi:hypothetical protein
LNFIIEEEICKELESLIPPGQRSRVVNHALRKELELIRRMNAAREIQVLSDKGKRFSTDEIVDGLRKDRGGH